MIILLKYQETKNILDLTKGKNLKKIIELNHLLKF